MAMRLVNRKYKTNYHRGSIVMVEDLGCRGKITSSSGDEYLYEGNMYPWVDFMHCHLGGECPHKCSYCYVNNPKWGRPDRYKGEIRIIESELKVKYGSGKTIFMEYKNDFLAKEVSDELIFKIIDHAFKFPDNTYVWQSKNPARFLTMDRMFPVKSILGTTIETNRDIPKEISLAPRPEERMLAMEKLKGRKFLTVEPVMDFDVDILASWIDRIRPEFLNLGADSKNHHLPEPTVDKVYALTNKLHEYGIELREKYNLNRLIKKSD